MVRDIDKIENVAALGLLLGAAGGSNEEAAAASAQQAAASAASASASAEEAATKLDEINETVDNIPSDYQELINDVSGLKADLSDKDALTVGTAKQLVGDKFTEDKVPYLFRQSGGGLTVGNREYLDAVVGGSVVWNQLADVLDGTSSVAGTTVAKENGTITVSGTATASSNYNINTVGITSDHVYVLSNYPQQMPINSENANATLQLYLAGFSLSITENATSNYKMAKSAVDGSGTLRGRVQSGETYDLSYCPQLFDLTAMFGTEIADYIYALEQANAGDGVAFFKKLFPEDYYAYNPVELISVSGVSAHETVGFNQWDEEWELGNISAENGTNSASSTRIRSKNYIRVFPGVKYYANAPATLGLRFYNANKGFISATSVASKKTFTIPQSAVYMRFIVVDFTTYSHDICINISDPKRNGTYEPYTKHSYPLDSTLTLRGVPKLVDGKIQYDGDRYLPDGTVERRYGVVDLGTLTGYVNNGGNGVYVAIPNKKQGSNNTICPYEKRAQSEVASSMPENSYKNYSTSNSIAIHKTGITSNNAQTMLSGIYFVYELATPTTETAAPYRSDQLLDAGGTEEFISTSLVPVGHETRYAEDLIKKLESLPWDMSMIAPIETGTTASQAYAVGKYFILNDQFCKAKTAIASGATFTLNTNYEVTTVADELYTALH